MTASVPDPLAAFFQVAGVERVRISVHLRSGCTRVAAAGGGRDYAMGGRGVRISDGTPRVLALLDLLENEGAPWPMPSHHAAANDNAPPPVYVEIVGAFSGLAALKYTIRVADRVIACWIPEGTSGDAALRAVDPAIPHVLSRFAIARRDGASLVLETSLSDARVELHDPVAHTLLAALMQPRSVGDLCAATGADVDVVLAFVTLLASAQLLTPVVNGAAAEDLLPQLVQWQPHDAYFHAKSRWGRREETAGLYRFPDIDPLPAVKPTMSGDIIPLVPADLVSLGESDDSFTSVLERRRSHRRYASRLTCEQLGQFLHRAARVVRFGPPELAPYENSVRPSPSGGACHALELYPLVYDCDGLSRALYHYDPLDHRLERLVTEPALLSQLHASYQLDEAQWGPRQVVIIIAARFRRSSWKYPVIAYAVALKDAGALTQTMYLVATAMGLSPCGVGVGDAELFARTIGTDFMDETSIAELMLGGAPALRPSESDTAS